MTDAPVASNIPPGAVPATDKAYPARDLGGALDKPGLGWVIFEWARNPYYILVVIYVFAPYFAGVIGQTLIASGDLAGVPADQVQPRANAAGQAAIASVTKTAGFIAALTAPFLGAALDRGGRRKPIMAVFLGILAFGAWQLWYAAPDGSGHSIPMTMGFLVLAYVAYTYSEVTHNAMLGVAGRPQSLPMISGLGLGLGNLAGALLLVVIVFGLALPDMIGVPFAEPLFGIDPARGEHFRMAGPLTAVWLVVFAVPFFLWARDGGTPGASWPKAFRNGAVGLWTTVRRASQNRNILTFLLARMLYADAMAALLTLGAVYAALMFGWTLVDLSVYAIVSSVAAFGGGIVGGLLDRAVGPKRALIIEITVMLATLLVQLSLTPNQLFFGLVDNRPVWDGIVFSDLASIVYLATIIPLAISATASISSSRSMLVHLAPPERVGEFFGLYAIAGTITVWLGPLLVEIFTEWSGNQRIGMSAISVLFLAGLAVLVFVKADRTPEHLTGEAPVTPHSGAGAP